MAVTVVIPTTMERSSLRQAVESVLRSASQLPDAEILVVANGPAAGRALPFPDHLTSAPRTAGPPRVRVIRLAEPSIAGARNAGIAQACHERILMTDDDCVVPPSWCGDLAGVLSRPGAAVVTGPIRVDVRGPVTAYLDYQRLFDAPPIDETHVRYLITANCGLRRDVLAGRVTFDAGAFAGTAGEDTGFGYAVRDLGLPIHWLGNHRPVRHVLTESVAEITGRFMGYGRSSARLFHRLGRWSESVPDPLDLLAAIADGRCDEHRLFAELADPDVRRAFATYELVLLSAFMVGYLEECGTEVGTPLLATDHAGLDQGWHEIDQEVRRTSTGDLSWPNLRTDLPGWAGRLALGQGGRPVPAVAATLARFAHPTWRNPPPEVAAALNRGRDRLGALRAERRAQLWSVAQDCADLAGADELDRRLRGVGVPYGDGCRELEKIVRAGATLRRATAAG